MANSQLNTQWITMSISRGLYNKPVIMDHFDDSKQKDYMRDFPVGATIYPRLPYRFVQKTGLNLQLQPIVDRVTSITMDQIFQYSVDFDSVEQALTLARPDQELFRQLADPISDQLAQDADSAAAYFVLQNTSNVAGAVGTAIASLATLRDTTQKMVELAGWKDMLGVITPGMANQIVGLGQTFFNDPQTVSKQFKTMKIGTYANADWVQSMSLYSHTIGTAVTSLAVSGANQSGTTLNVVGTAAQVINQNDILVIGSGATGMYAVNPATRRSILALAQIKAAQSLTLTGGTDALTLMSPGIIGPGSQYQNVDALPQDAAAITLWPGTTSPSGKSGALGALFAGDAFFRVSAKLREPQSCEYHASQTYNGVTARTTVTWDEVLSRMIMRVDSLFGFGRNESENKSILLAGSV